MPERLVSSSGTTVADSIAWLRTPVARARGLVGRPQPGARHALVLAPAVQVHTFLLRYSIDVALCDASWTVLWVGRSMVPNRVSPFIRAARFAVEMRAGSFPADVHAGSCLSVVE